MCFGTLKYSSGPGMVNLCIFVYSCGLPGFCLCLNEKPPSSLRLCVKLYNPKLTTATQSVTLFSPTFSSPSPFSFLLCFCVCARLASPHHWYSMFFVCMFSCLKDRKDTKQPWDPKRVYGVCVGVIIFVSALFLAWRKLTAGICGVLKLFCVSSACVFIFIFFGASV